MFDDILSSIVICHLLEPSKNRISWSQISMMDCHAFTIDLSLHWSYVLLFLIWNKGKPIITNVILYQWTGKEWGSEGLFNANSAIFQLYHGENKLIFNEMMIRSALY